MSKGNADGGRRPHVVIMNRWREHYAAYADYVDHRTHRVTYITTEIGLGSVPPDAADLAIVEATDDLAQARAAMRELAARNGPPDRIVALKEDDLLPCAQLRREWGLPGQQPPDLMRFRDKYLMGRAIVDAGLATPAFEAVSGPESVSRLASSVGWPLILKPRIGVASAGVVLLNSAADLAELPPWQEPMLVQAFNPHPIHHVDGVFTGHELATWRVSRYTNTCLGFRDGAFLGSVEQDDPAVNAAVEVAATAFLRALTDQPIPFHLELFVRTDGDRVSCSFLEVGARVGAAEIPFIWRDLHGYDLMRAAFELQLGLPAPVPDPRLDTGEVGGWLLIPAPASRPCRITEAPSMVGNRPGPYAESLLRPGEVLPAADAFYEHVGGRFRFRGGSTAEVDTALAATATGFRVSAEPAVLSPGTAR